MRYELFSWNDSQQIEAECSRGMTIPNGGNYGKNFNKSGSGPVYAYDVPRRYC